MLVLAWERRCYPRAVRCEAMVPRHLELERDHGLRIEWSDGRSSYLPVALLRKMSPSAETKKLREEMASNPLAVLPSSGGGQLRRGRC